MVTRLDCGDALSKSMLIPMMSYGEFSMKGRNRFTSGNSGVMISFCRRPHTFSTVCDPIKISLSLVELRLN